MYPPHSPYPADIFRQKLRPKLSLRHPFTTPDANPSQLLFLIAYSLTLSAPTPYTFVYYSPGLTESQAQNCIRQSEVAHKENSRA